MQPQTKLFLRPRKKLFESIWQEEYILGGLLWNWQQNVRFPENTDFNLQNKPAEGLVKEWFRKESKL